MNSGKVCVSVCADTAAEFLKAIEAAKPLADVVELRFDCLDGNEIFSLRDEIYKEAKRPVPFITTFRSREQGGNRDITFDQREDFWNYVSETEFADVEEDLIERTDDLLWPERICSFHDFKGAPENLEKVYNRLCSTGAEIVKIAVQVNDAVEAIPIWRLLKSVAKKKKLIPVAMGEAGKWTRILGLAHGAYLTYAALGSGNETAPGQITALEMNDVFRVKELDESTEVYGIIAGDTSYSMSPFIHNAAFKSTGRNAVFVPFQVSDLDQFIRRMVSDETREVELNFHGFSVTNPHKQAILKYLDHVDEDAQKIGAVNTIKMVDGKLHGFNTDVLGFIGPLISKLGNLANARVAVVGAGGAARAAAHALTKAEADVTIFARDPDKGRSLADEFQTRFQKLETGNSKLETVLDPFDIVVNATPLGTRGANENETMANAEQLRNVKLVYDLIYNPTETRLIREAKAAGAETLGGFDMLIVQAVEQQRIWTGEQPDADAMTSAARNKLDER